MMKKLIVAFLMLTMLVGCAPKKESKDIRVAEQFGLAYAPLQIMKANGYLEEEYKDGQVSWLKLGNTAAIREAALSQGVDVGFMGIPPFLISADKGMEWRIFTGLSEAPLGLITYDESIKLLSDIGPEDKIALPQPGSIQHILLSMAAEKDFGNPKKFDNQLVTMKHPDGMMSLLNKGDIKAHYTSPPFIFKELENPGFVKVVDGNYGVGGDFTFIVGVATKEFYEGNKEGYEAFSRALDKSIDFMNENKDETINILSESYDIEAEILKSYMAEMYYSDEIKGLDRFISFMHDTGYIENDLSEDDVLWK
jgi:NitT/TauT family transport system substrate-binding protein